MTKPLVLLSNDDGVGASGLRSVRNALLPYADVIVCAPETNQSATSHSLTLSRVLRLRTVEPGVFSVDGTPADCVYVALNAGGRVLDRAPDLCVSGMNHGLNLGVDAFYSGTVAAAREAALRGIPAIALSADRAAHREHAAELGVKLALGLLELSTSAKTTPLFNVNFPPGDNWEVRATSAGKRVYDNAVVFRKDPRGAEYLWIGGSIAVHHDSPGADTEAFDAGVVSVTPLSLDLFEPGSLAIAADVVGKIDSARRSPS